MDIQQPMNARDLIESDEGFEIFPYTDSRGIKSYGVGHNMEAAPLCATTMLLLAQAVNAQFDFDLSGAIAALSVYPFWSTLSDNHKVALQDMMFNLGATRFAEFTNFIALLNARQPAKAAADLRTTAVYTELPKRYERLAAILETEDAQS